MGCRLWLLQQIDKDVVALAIRDDDADASLLHLLCRGVLRMHAAATEGTLLFLDILREVATWLHLRDEVRGWMIGMTIEDAINIAQQNERTGLHHLSDEP